MTGLQVQHLYSLVKFSSVQTIIMNDFLLVIQMRSSWLDCAALSVTIWHGLLSRLGIEPLGTEFFKNLDTRAVNIHTQPNLRYLIYVFYPHRFAGGIGALFCIVVAVFFVMSTSEAALVSRLRLNLPTKIPRGDIIVEFPDFEFIQNLSRQAKDGLEQNIVDQGFIRRTLGKASEILGVAFNDFGVVEIVLKGIVPILALVTLVYYLALRMSLLLKETLLSIVRLN